eukprot:12583524-Alexandrium_andersonii.AAC.1
MSAWGSFPRMLAARRSGGRRSACLRRRRQSALCDGRPYGENRAGKRRGAAAMSQVGAEGEDS